MLVKKSVVATEKLVHLHEFDGMDVSTIPKKKLNNGGGGGNDMSNYVTKEEFNIAINNLTHQMKLNQEKINSNFSLISQKIESTTTAIPDKIQISLDAKEKEDRKDATETRRYIVGTIIMSVIGIIVSLIV